MAIAVSTIAAIKKDRHLQQGAIFFRAPRKIDYSIELSVLNRQCLDGRIPDMDTLKLEVTAWESQRNQIGSSVDWRFTTADARIKLHRLYPSIQT